MKVMLVNAPYVDIYGPIKSASGRYFPLGIGYIASYLRQKGVEVFFADPEVDGVNAERLASVIRQIKPDIVGVSCATPNFSGALAIAKITKEVSSAKTVLGGVHASAVPQLILNTSEEFDVVVVGEGERTMEDLAAVLQNGGDLGKVAGVCYRQDGNVIQTDPRPHIADVDSLPFPARDMVDLRMYSPHSHNARSARSATMITSRGCPFHCSFCASYLTMGTKFRPHSPEYVVEEISLLVNKYGMKHILFQDDTFTVDKQRVLRICELIRQRDLKFEWFCFAHINTMDRELLQHMKDAGCYSIGYGIESGDKEVLKKMGKTITLERVKEVLDATNSLKIKSQAFFIFGSEGETRETIEKTIQLAIALKPVLAFFNILIPYPGTQIFEKYCRDINAVKNWGDFVAIGINPAVDTGGLNKEDLRKAMYNAYVRFYARPSQLLHMARSIRSTYEVGQYMNGGWGLLKQCLVWFRKSSS